MALYDFFDPFLSVRIVPLAGGVPFVFATKVVPGSEEHPLVSGMKSAPFVQQLTVENNLANAPKISVQLAMPFPDGIKLLDSKLIDFGSNVLEVQFGYRGKEGGESPVFRGLLTPPEVQIGTDFTITLKGEGTADFDIKRKMSTLSWANKSRKAMLEDLVKGPDVANKRKMILDDSEVTKADSPESFRLLNQDPISEAQGGKMTDYQLIRKLAHDSRCWVNFETDTAGTLVAKLRPRSARIASTAEKIFQFFGTSEVSPGQIGPAVAVYPILTVNSSTDGLFAPGALKSMVIRGLKSSTRGGLLSTAVTAVSGAVDSFATFIDEFGVKPARTDKGNVDVEEGDNKTGINKDGKALGVDGASIKGAGAPTHSTSPNDLRGAAQANSDYEVVTAAIGISLDVSTLGVPDIVPGDTVQVRGLGRRFDTAYWVQKVVHTVGGSGFTSQFTLQNNVVPNTSGEGSGKKNDNSPKTEAPGRETTQPT